MAKSEIFQTVTVNLGHHQYPIHIGRNLLQDSEFLKRYIAAQQILIVTNETIAPLYLNSVKASFAAFQCDQIILPDGEAFKNETSLFTIFDTLLNNKHHRDTTIIALGGGVIGDITGFAAATFQRGVRLVQLPTTLLAQVDASVGGKTAINHALGKNMIGSFYQPHAVLMDLNTLNSLPDRELCAGFAEVIKYGLLEGGDLLKQLDNILSQGLLALSNEQLAKLIADCCRVKARFVQEDERELGSRALLNLGHTFAHALESYTHYEYWLHGEAVAIGLYCAGLLSHQLGYLSASDLLQIDLLLQSAQLPRRIPKDINIQKLQDYMIHDKKVKNNTLRFVLLRAPGDCYLDSSVDGDSLRQALISATEGAT